MFREQDAFFPPQLMEQVLLVGHQLTQNLMLQHWSGEQPVEVRQKGDSPKSIVTSIDTRVQNVLVSATKKLAPEFGVDLNLIGFYGEEEDLCETDKPYVVIFDPIDGTCNLEEVLRGGPQTPNEFAVSGAVLKTESQQVVTGGVLFNRMKKLFVGDRSTVTGVDFGKIRTRRQQLSSVSEYDHLTLPYATYRSSNEKVAASLDKIYNHFAQQNLEQIRTGCGLYDLGLLFLHLMGDSRRVGFTLNGNSGAWDFLGAQVLLETLGFVFRNWQNQEVVLNLQNHNQKYGFIAGSEATLDKVSREIEAALAD